MRRENRTSSTHLTLAPILNIVVILIPMLLLAIVFINAGVINVSTPKVGPLTESDSTVETTPPVIAITSDGFLIQTDDRNPVTIPTSRSTQNLPEQIAALRDNHDPQKMNAAIESWVGAYDYDGLYDEMESLPQNGTVFHITADPSVPYAVVVRTMDAVRHRVERKPAQSIWDGKKVGTLFSDPTLALAK